VLVVGLVLLLPACTRVIHAQDELALASTHHSFEGSARPPWLVASSLRHCSSKRARQLGCWGVCGRVFMTTDQ
jgi:hypothetical protein